MTKPTKSIALATATACFGLLAACTTDGYTKSSGETMSQPEVTAKEMPTIVGLAAGSDQLTTLVAAVTAADLVDTLNSAGPFTVFAPTDAAFGKLPAGTVETLVMPENKEKLSGILTYHVVSGEVMAADLVKAITDNGGNYTVPTVNGGKLKATIINDNVYLIDANGGSAKVIATDLDASNGVVHLINTVVMPK
jgi:uncharacterized surface protein with fasciclin (FAS1) repeats